MALKALEKLRKCAEHESAGFFVNLEQAFGLSRYKCGDSTFKPNGGAILNAIADEVEAEIATRIMLLPVDADGVLIKLGDRLKEHEDGNEFTVDGIKIWGNTYEWWAYQENGIQAPMTRCTHVKPRTLEDVLNDVATVGVCYQNRDDIRAEKLEKYADEIRELMRGDA